MRYIIGAAALLCSSAAFGQQLTCKSSEVCLSWTPPTHFERPCTDNANPLCARIAIPSDAVITYRIYRLTNGIMTGLSNTTTGTGIKLLNQPRGNQCYSVSATVNGVESVLASPMKCKMVRFPGPTDGGIERPTDGGIERN